MTAPIKTCDYCFAQGEMPTFMSGETICHACLPGLPKTLPEARHEIARLKAKAKEAENHYDRVFKQLLRERKITSAMTHNVMQMASELKELAQQEAVATVRINAINGNPSVDFVPGHHYLHHNDKLYLAPGAQPAPSVPDSLPVYADPFTYVIQHLNSNPYSLTKDECVTLIKELRDLYNSASEAKP